MKGGRKREREALSVCLLCNVFNEILFLIYI